MGGFALSDLLGSGRASIFPLGTLSLGLWVIAVDPALIRMGFFPSLKQNFIAYGSSSLPDCIFEILQLWQSGFSRVYSNSCCSFSFEPEIIQVGQSSYKMSSNDILNFQESTTILNACTKKSLETYWRHHVIPLHGIEHSYLIQITCTHFRCFKYFNQIQIIHIQFYGLKWLFLSNNSHLFVVSNMVSSNQW